MRRSTFLAIAVCAVALVPHAKADPGDHVDPIGGASVAMREIVYEKLGQAQTAAQEERFDDAIALLDGVAKSRDLTPYERAQLSTAYGYVHFSRGDLDASVTAYEAILDLHHIPETLRSGTQFTLAQLEFQRSNFARAVEHLEDWMADADDPGPEPLMLLAHAMYQLGRYQEAIAPTERAIHVAKGRGLPLDENAYLLLRAIHAELENYPKLLDVLEVLVETFPRKEYWLHLAATYSAVGDDARELAAYEIAHDAGYLDRGDELRLLAELLIRADVPYRAGIVLANGLDGGLVANTAENLRLLSQAWMLAHENERAIDALIRAAELSDDPEYDARLAQCYANLRRWEESEAAARAGLEKGAERAHELHLTRGIALVELDRPDEALASFRRAAATPDLRDTATRWITYIESTTARDRELRRSLR